MSQSLSPLLTPRENGLLYSLISHDCSTEHMVVTLMIHKFSHGSQDSYVQLFFNYANLCKQHIFTKLRICPDKKTWYNCTADYTVCGGTGSFWIFVVLACGIVQLVIAAPPKKREWKSHSFGVLCLVQDKSMHSTFMRLYCLKKAKLQWEQELYTPFEYSETCPYFHTFPGDECQMGINFADEDEAKQFYTAVQKQISDNKAFHSGLTRRYSVGAVSDWKDKLDNCLRGHEVQKRSASRVPHRLDSDATFPMSKSSQINDSSQTPSSVNEESISLAQRKGPLPPLPLHARAAMLKLNRSASMQNFDSTIHVPPPPSYRAPATPLKSAVKDRSSAGMKKTLHHNVGIEDESGYDDYL